MLDASLSHAEHRRRTLVVVADDARLVLAVAARARVAPLRVCAVEQRPLVASARHVGQQDRVSVEGHVYVGDAARVALGPEGGSQRSAGADVGNMTFTRTS